MYAIIIWIDENNNYVTFVHNNNGSIKLFDKLKSADVYASEIDRKQGESITRVISIEGVKE